MENKSMGSALVEVFDAAVSLAKSEISGILKRVGEVAKAKGIGVLLLLGAAGPLILALIFLILFVFYGLMRLGLGAWAAALLISLVSFALTGALVLLGVRRLTAEVREEPRKLSPTELDDLRYGGQQGGGQGGAPGASPSPGPQGDTMSSGNHEAGSVPSSGVNERSQREGGAQANVTGEVANPQSAGTRMAQEFGGRGGEVQAQAAQKVYYEGDEIGAGQKKSEEDEAHSANVGVGTEQPLKLGGREAPGIPVSTEPTYREDMKKEGY